MNTTERFVGLALVGFLALAGLVSGTGCGTDDENATDNTAFYGTFTYWQESERCTGITKSALTIGSEEERIKKADREDQYIYLPENETTYEYEYEDSDDKFDYWYKVSISGRTLKMEQEKGDKDWSYTITMVFDSDSNNTGTMSGKDYYKLWDCRSFNGTFRKN
ncbi:MAG: hypothetical protein EOM25_07205 [Deltaproteobacteria bacterium]|nr:hypothetical protein [Deltaproteobacteria bacterium]